MRKIGDWVYRPLYERIAQIDKLLDDGGFEAVVFSSLGAQVGRDTNVMAPGVAPTYWVGIRKPSFPIPTGCERLDDVLIPDVDVGLSDQQMQSILNTPRLVNPAACIEFYSSKGFVEGKSVAQTDLIEEMGAKYGRPFREIPIAELSVEDFILTHVRPTNSSLSLGYVDYPLSTAVDSWNELRNNYVAMADAPRARETEMG